MVAEEHDDASPDDVEPGLLLPQHPAEPSSSSPALPLAVAAPWLIHPPARPERTEAALSCEEPGWLCSTTTTTTTTPAGSASTMACGQVTASRRVNIGEATKAHVFPSQCLLVHIITSHHIALEGAYTPPLQAGAGRLLPLHNTSTCGAASGGWRLEPSSVNWREFR